MSTSELDCGLAQLARMVLIEKQIPVKHDIPKRHSATGLAVVLGLNNQQIYDRVSGRPAFRPAEGRAPFAYTEGACMAWWLLEGSCFQVAPRPKPFKAPKAVSANLLNETPDKLHMLTWSKLIVAE